MLPHRTVIAAALFVSVALLGLTLFAAATEVRAQPAPIAQFEQACQTDNPFFATTQFAKNNSAAEPALVSFHSTATGTDHSVLARIGELGAAYGVAYHPGQKALFVAAYHKRGAAFGPGGPGAIYRYDLATDAAVVWVTVPNAGPDTHDPAGGYFPDSTGRTEAGRTGLGDVDLNEDGSELFVTNLADRKIYRYRVADKSLIGTIDHGAAGAAWAADARPFGLKVAGGKLYHGVVNSAQSTQSPADLWAYVYESDLDGSNMRLATGFSLVYDRGLVDDVAAVPAKWQPWKDGLCIINNPGGSVNWNICPQPMLTDIEVAPNRDLVLGLRDRNGDMTFFANTAVQVPPGEGNGIAAGDILISRFDGRGWNTRPDPEFFAQDAGPGFQATESVHDESGFGGLARVFSAPIVAMTGVTPLRVLTGGGFWFNTATGVNTAREELYHINDGPNFGKANGLGDLETLCLPPPPTPTLCLGDLVWNDPNNNGRFDPTRGETGIANVDVQLYKDTNGDGHCSPGTDELVGSTHTGPDGRYAFCGLAPGEYVVTIPAANFAAGKPLAGKKSSTGNDPAPDPDDDVDNDDNGTGEPSGDTCCQAVTLTIGGEPVGDGDADRNTNWTVDFGFVSDPPAPTPTPMPDQPLCVGNLVWRDHNNNGHYDPITGEGGIPGVNLTLLKDVDGDGKCTAGMDQEVATGSSNASGIYTFCLSPLPANPEGDYVVVVPGANFAPGGPLDGWRTSTGNDPAPDPDDDKDDDDNGAELGPDVCAGAVTLTFGDEPRDDGDDDGNTNWTVDLGFTRRIQQATETPTTPPSATFTPTAPITPSATPPPSITPTPPTSPPPTVTMTPSATAIPTATFTPSATAVPTATFTPSTPTPTPPTPSTPTPTPTITPPISPTPTPTHTAPSTPTPTRTGSPPPTATPTPVPSLTPTPVPTNTPLGTPPGATATLTPAGTAPPPTATAYLGCVPQACPLLTDGYPPDVPLAEIHVVLNNPNLIAGWAQPMDPGKPVGPFNPLRCWLTVRNPSAPYAVPYNQMIWKASCP